MGRSDITNISSDDFSCENSFEADVKYENVSDNKDPLINLSQLKYEDYVNSPSNHPEDLGDNIKTEDISFKYTQKEPKHSIKVNRKKIKLKKIDIGLIKTGRKKLIEEESEDEIKITDKNLSHLSREEQLRELDERRRREEFIKAIYKCDDCAIIFKNNFYLENHMKKHDIVSTDF